MARAGPMPAPLHLGTSMVVRSLKKKKSSWFRCNSGDFDDNDRARVSSQPFVSLPLDPFARYTIPSRREKQARTPTLEFPSPPPRSPVTFRQNTISYPLELPDRCSEWATEATRRNHLKFKTKIDHAEVVARTGYINELEESRESSPTGSDDRQADVEEWDSDRGTIFTLFGDAQEWDEFQDALFFLRPSKLVPHVNGDGNDDDDDRRLLESSSLPSSSQPSYSSLIFTSSPSSSSSSSASSVYSTMTTPELSCNSSSHHSN